MENACEASPTDGVFVPYLATVYEHLVRMTPPCRGLITRFHAIKPPDISIKDYLDRIQRYFGCSNECFVLSLVYIDRIVKTHADFSVSILNVHRLLITSIMLAAKFFDDVYYSNAFYARVGGVRTKEINVLEAHFLSLLDFHLFVSPIEYDQYRQNVLTAVNVHHFHRPIPEAGQQPPRVYTSPAAGSVNRARGPVAVPPALANVPPQENAVIAGSQSAAPISWPSYDTSGELSYSSAATATTGGAAAAVQHAAVQHAAVQHGAVHGVGSRCSGGQEFMACAGLLANNVNGLPMQHASRQQLRDGASNLVQQQQFQTNAEHDIPFVVPIDHLAPGSTGVAAVAVTW